jgi:hypothetical protein
MVSPLQSPAPLLASFVDPIEEVVYSDMATAKTALQAHARC